VLDACVAIAGANEPTRIDPAALSARIAGMIACLMRMIFLHGIDTGQRPAACLTKPTGASELYVSYCQYLALMYQGKSLCKNFNSEIFRISCLQETFPDAGKDWLYFAVQGSLQCAPRLREMGNGGTSLGELMSENIPLVP
jgi:hypothetical protein